ncbi:MAG: TraM recognition domain-containing protein [Sphingobacteriales bacterium]|nr:TraM recognition domain-containing protein [Sphingobacteriales bacterium]
MRTLINPFIMSYRDGIMDLLDSQVSSAKIPLARLSSPDLYYILTGNDCTLEINDPAAPKILCLGGDPSRQEALGPVLSLYIDQLNRLVNRAGRHPCALVCDEFATVRAFSMVTTMATARSNNIVPVLSMQDINQLRTQYSKGEADMILAIAGNVFCGQVGGETALRVSERFPKILRGWRPCLPGN